MQNESTETEKKPIVTKNYTVKVDEFENGTNCMKRTNDGFNPLELIGIADLIAIEVRQQILGELKYDIVKREVIKD